MPRLTDRTILDELVNLVALVVYGTESRRLIHVGTEGSTTGGLYASQDGDHQQHGQPPLGAPTQTHGFPTPEGAPRPFGHSRRGRTRILPAGRTRCRTGSTPGSPFLALPSAQPASAR